MEARYLLVVRFSTLLLLLGFVCYMVGFATPWWLKGRHIEITAGLWQNCIGSHCASTLNGETGDWLSACQALTISALLTSLMALGVSAIMVRASRDSTLSAARYGTIATTLFSGASVVTSLVLYYVCSEEKYPQEFYGLSLSFILVAVGGGVFLCVALVLGIDAVTSKLRHGNATSS